MKVIISGLVVMILAILGFGIGLSIVLGVAFGFGWILMQIIDVTLFEAMLLVMVASVIFSALFDKIINLFTAGMDFDEDDLDAFLEEKVDSKIPLERFVTDSPIGITEESMFRYHIANAVFDGLDDLPRSVGLNSEQQIIELAVRLTDPVVSILKRRKKRVATVTISKSALTKELRRDGLRPYDDDILETAVESTNLALDNPDMVNLVNGKMWHMPLLYED